MSRRQIGCTKHPLGGWCHFDLVAARIGDQRLASTALSLALTGYVLDEKLQIARQHLLPRQLECNGLSPRALELPEESIAALVDGYTREAGVRLAIVPFSLK